MQISIFLDGDEVAIRNWDQVPRRDDFIKLLGNFDGWYLIKEVNWYGDNSPCATLHVEKYKDSAL